MHIPYGGVVPEIAARSHIESIVPVINDAIQQAFPGGNRSKKGDLIDAIAVTYGAGLGGSLLIGVLTARTLSIAWGKPLYAINHVEGHIYANFLNALSPGYERLNPKIKVPRRQPRFPMLGLIVSGGHTQLALWQNHFEYQLLGQTRDDAIGEAFDKTAKILGLPYPGGPSVSKAAESGDAYAYEFPKARFDKTDSDNRYDFSFSGLKTAVLRKAQEACGQSFDFPSHALPALLSDRQKSDIAASFQRVAIETVVDKTVQAYAEFKPRSFVIGGGVAANQELRRQLSERVATGIDYQDASLMTDNAAMIAALGCFTAKYARPQADPYALEISPSLSM